MDEKKFEAGDQAPQENQNTQENINNQSGAAQQNAQQNAGSSESGSGWVFSDKNVSGAHQQDESGTSQQPNQEGWYRSGPQQSHEQAGQDQNQNPAYSSRYSYGESASRQGQQAENSADSSKSGEHYKWNYEDYQQTPKAEGKHAGKKKNKGLKVFAGIMCAILCVGVVSLAGYGTYALVSNQQDQQSAEATTEGTDEQNQSSTTLVLNDKPSTSNSSASVDLSEGELTITERAEKVLPSTVGIVSYIQNQQSIFGGEQSQGSGIIISADGYIVTNEHVISGATSIKVVLQDDSEYNATLVGSDERTDLAVLKIDATGLTPAEFGNSDQMQIGEQVIAIGNPGGLELAGTVTVGYVSAVNRSITTTNGNTVNCIQTDAAINPGNSGGALVNTYGQVIGINSQKIAATDYEGIGFAISINEAQPIINDLIQYGYVRGRVVMGITMQMIDQTYAAIYGYQPGIGVVSVEAGSPAEEAGLVAGDIITAIDGQSITTQEELNTLLEQYSPGDTITLTVYRQSVRGDGQELSMELTFAEAGAPSDTTTQQSSQQSTQQSQAQNESSTSPWSWMFQ